MVIKTSYRYLQLRNLMLMNGGNYLRKQGLDVVPVAKHHDGFSMYDSELNPWNSVKMGPKRDIVGLLQKASEREGLIFGLSTHHVENAWFYGEGMKFPSDVQDSTITLYGERLERNQVNEKFMRNYLMHTHELI